MPPLWQGRACSSGDRGHAHVSGDGPTQRLDDSKQFRQSEEGPERPVGRQRGRPASGGAPVRHPGRRRRRPGAQPGRRRNSQSQSSRDFGRARFAGGPVGRTPSSARDPLVAHRRRRGVDYLERRAGPGGPRARTTASAPPSLQHRPRLGKVRGIGRFRLQPTRAESEAASAGGKPPEIRTSGHGPAPVQTAKMPRWRFIRSASPPSSYWPPAVVVAQAAMGGRSPRFSGTSSFWDRFLKCGAAGSPSTDTIPFHSRLCWCQVTFTFFNT